MKARAACLQLAAATLAAAQSAQALEPSEVFDKVAPSVWVVRTFDGAHRALGLGSAVVVGNGRLITNCHVLAKANSVVVRRKNVSYDAKLLHADAPRDLCLLDVDDFAAPAVAMAPRESLKVGEKVYAIGNPQGFETTLSEGLISGLRGEWADGSHVLQTTAAISPGSSGGGLFDDKGRLVGITTFTRTDAQNLNFALPAEWIAEVPVRAEAALAKRKEEPPVAAYEAAPFGTPLPRDVGVRAPSAETPAQRAAFSGAWAGKWVHGRAHTLVVERIDERSVRLVYSWGPGGRRKGEESPGGFRRVLGQFADDGALRTSMPNGATVTYRLAADRHSLQGEYVRDGQSFQGVFEHRDLP